ncbi:glyoxalase domain-containing protein 4 [Ditylenchus destructor]|nr:glyoxalase domain-containing protein 4 [Ditylenchus destructor]
MSVNSRALHYVFRVGNRKASYDFFVKTLGMKVLRHEEFYEPCKASCNGPFDGKWSKTMIGYGSEDDHFVLELTYNYGISSYELGNDFAGIHIESDSAFKNAQESGEKCADGIYKLKDPDGHAFFVKSGNNSYPVVKISVNVKNLDQSKEFWSSLCGMTVETSSEDKCILSYGKDQCKLELNSLNGVDLNRGTAFGRIAFACPTNELKQIEERMNAANPHFVQTPLVSLDTPGKSTVWVVILRDPNDHEICFVGDEAYKELSMVDPNAKDLLEEAIANDPSLPTD